VTDSSIASKMKMSLMMMMMMVVVGVSLMAGSDALTCYKCQQTAGGVNLTTIYKAGDKCFDPSLLTEDDTCEAKEYCAKHWSIQCHASTIHSFTLSSSIVNGSLIVSSGSSSRYLGDLCQQVEYGNWLIKQVAR